jgi:F420-dependent oxidoreductase-like protein
VDLRIFIEPHQGASYADILRVAQASEAAGFDGFFRSDHLAAMDHMPKAAGTGAPGPTDAWTTLSALAVQTERITLGTLVTSITFRLPGPLAIAVAQADQMSGGRIELGIGAGWYEPEHTAYGVPFPPLGTRFDQLTEQLAVLTGLWSTPEGETFSHPGEHYAVVDSPALPKPAHPIPVIMGGYGRKRTPALAARYAAEINVPFGPLDVSLDRFELVDGACTAIGRDPASMVRSTANVVVAGRTDAELARRAAFVGRDLDDLRANAFAGSPAEIVDLLGTWREKAGVSRAYLQILDLADLDHLDLVASEIAPHLA